MANSGWLIALAAAAVPAIALAPPLLRSPTRIDAAMADLVAAYPGQFAGYKAAH